MKFGLNILAQKIDSEMAIFALKKKPFGRNSGRTQVCVRGVPNTVAKFLPGTSLCSDGPKHSLVGGGVRLRCKAGSTKGFVEAESKFQGKSRMLLLFEVPVEFKS